MSAFALKAIREFLIHLKRLNLNLNLFNEAITKSTGALSPRLRGLCLPRRSADETKQAKPDGSPAKTKLLRAHSLFSTTNQDDPSCAEGATVAKVTAKTEH